MATFGSYILILVAGFVAAIGTGLGTVPLFWAREVSDRWNVGMWGFAGGLMVSASVFGLLVEAFKKHAGMIEVGLGLLAGVLIVVVAHNVVERYDYSPKEIPEANFAKILTILVVLAVHSFPEGVAIGVSFAELNQGSGLALLGFTIPILAIVMTVALAVHNIPEGLAVGIPLRREDSVNNAQMFGAAILTSVPQPLAAVVAFYFVRLAQQFLGFGYGFAAGAMIYLVAEDIIPEGLEEGENLPSGGKPQLAAGLAIGFVLMIPLLFFG